MSGGSTGSLQTTGSTTAASPPWVQDAASTYLNNANSISQNPYTPSPTQAVGLNGTQQTALDAIQNRALSGSPVQSAANSSLTNIVNGGNLNSNPYIDQMANSALTDVTRQYNDVVRPQQQQAMINSGSFGNSGLQQQTQDQDRTLQESLGNIDANIRGNAYTAGLGQQTSALGLAPSYANQDYTDANALLGAGNTEQQNAQQQAAQNLQWYNEAQQYPINQNNVLGNAIGTVNGTSKTATTQQPGQSLASLLAGYGITLGGLIGNGG